MHNSTQKCRRRRRTGFVGRRPQQPRVDHSLRSTLNPCGWLFRSVATRGGCRHVVGMNVGHKGIFHRDYIRDPTFLTLSSRAFFSKSRLIARVRAADSARARKRSSLSPDACPKCLSAVPPPRLLARTARRPASARPLPPRRVAPPAPPRLWRRRRHLPMAPRRARQEAIRLAAPPLRWLARTPPSTWATVPGCSPNSRTSPTTVRAPLPSPLPRPGPALSSHQPKPALSTVDSHRASQSIASTTPCGRR